MGNQLMNTKTPSVPTYIKYFEGFNALRFIAAMFVVVHHAEQIRLTNGLANLKSYSFFQNGHLAVEFFFVLSGFLITYLLLKERGTTKTISIKGFYLRRILRIWPLYYLLVLLGLLVVPFILNRMGKPYELPFDPTIGWILYIFFLPNAVSSLYLPTGNLIYALWSIGVEEQFYIIWAPMFKYLYKWLTYILIGIIIFKFFLNERLLYMMQMDDSWTFWYKFSRTIKFELMSIGGLGAMYLCKKGSNSLDGSIIFKPVFQLFCFAILFIHFTCRNFIYQLDNVLSIMYSFVFNSKISSLILALLFLWLLLNTALNKNAFISFRNKTLNKFGEVSYGIYMYHIIIIYVVITIGNKWLNQNLFISELIFYGLVLPILFLTSFLSYNLFEKKLLNMKNLNFKKKL